MTLKHVVKKFRGICRFGEGCTKRNYRSSVRKKNSRVENGVLRSIKNSRDQLKIHKNVYPLTSRSLERE